MHVDDANAAHALDGVDPADGDGHQGREVGADGGERKCNVDIGTVKRSAFVCGERGLQRIRQWADCFHSGCDAVFQFLGFAGEVNKGSGGLVAGDFGCEFFNAACGFDAVGEADHGSGQYVSDGNGLARPCAFVDCFDKCQSLQVVAA